MPGCLCIWVHIVRVIKFTVFTDGAEFEEGEGEASTLSKVLFFKKAFVVLWRCGLKSMLCQKIIKEILEY